MIRTRNRGAFAAALSVPQPLRGRGAKALAATFVAVACSAAPAAASNVYTDVTMPNLTESPQVAGSYNQSSTCTGDISFRWVSDPNHTTVLGWNHVGSGAPSQTAAIGAHNTNRFSLPPTRSSCNGHFNLWARAAIGAGSMSSRTGNVGR